MSDNHSGHQSESTDEATTRPLRRTVGRVHNPRNTEPVPILDLARLARPSVNAPGGPSVATVVNAETLRMHRLLARLDRRPTRRVAPARQVTVERTPPRLL